MIFYFLFLCWKSGYSDSIGFKFSGFGFCNLLLGV